MSPIGLDFAQRYRNLDHVALLPEVRFVSPDLPGDLWAAAGPALRPTGPAPVSPVARGRTSSRYSATNAACDLSSSRAARHRSHACVCAHVWSSVDPPAARIDPNFPPMRSVMPGAGGAAPPVPTYVTPPQRPQIYCDPYGRCWRQVPGPSQGQRPGWNNSRPRPPRDPYGFDGPD